MPHTLAHYALQGPASRLLFGQVDPRWVMLGCVIPDLPWILQRIVKGALTGVDPYSLRLYFFAQSSLFVSLVLCAACAALTRHPRSLFLLLGFNSLAHLLLDACETKWGNGVLILAPFSWTLWNVGFFWPEQPLFYLLLTGLGLLYVAWAWRHGLWDRLKLQWQRWPIAVGLLILYLMLPLALVPSAYEADLQHAKTLKEELLGQAVAFDRERYEGELKPWNQKTYLLDREVPEVDGLVSLQGTLAADNVILVEQLHVHSGSSREIPSYVGLAILAAALVVGVFRARHRYARLT